MTDDQPLDPDLAAVLRASADARVQAQIQAARQQAAGKRAGRAEFVRNRDAGLRARHAAKAARLGLIKFHDSKETNVTAHTTADLDRLAERNASTYVLRTVEASREADPFDDYTDYPPLTAEQVAQAYLDLTAETAGVTVAFTAPTRRLPALQADGHIHYPRTQDMDLDTVQAALVTVAAEHAWLTRWQAQRADEFATLLRLRDQLSNTSA